MNTSTPILDAFDTALAQFRGTPAAQLGGRIRWTGTPEQVLALQSEIMGAPGGTFATATPTAIAIATATADGRSVYCGQWANVDLYSHPLGGGFSIDAEPVLAHPVLPVLIDAEPARSTALPRATFSEAATAAHAAAQLLPHAKPAPRPARSWHAGD